MFILDIIVWVFSAFSRVTSRTVTQRNYLNSMSDIEVDMYGGNESVSYLWSSSYPLFLHGLNFTRSALLCLNMFSNNTDRLKITVSVKHIVSYIFFTWTYLELYLCTKHLENILDFWIKPIIMIFNGLFPVTFSEPLVVTQWTPRKLQRNNCEFH